MSQENAKTAEASVPFWKEMFSSKNMKLLTRPFGADNPVTVQVLGICSALAVTAKLQPALVMAISVTVVTAFSNLIISLLRNTIPPRIRIIVQLVSLPPWSSWWIRF